MSKSTIHFIVAALLSAGCSRSETTNPTTTEPGRPASAPVPDDSRTRSGERSEKPRDISPPQESARIGQPAPDFTLPDLDGSSVRLRDHLGKIVVLEWFNPECPFVRAAHTQGSLIDTARKLEARGVVYFAINSGAAGKQGHGKEANQEGKERFQLTHPVLLDEAGHVGRAYGATNTPHIFVIDREGRLAYSGAVDNSPDGEGKSPQGGKLVNYLLQAVNELEADQPVSIAKTKAYGCSVKYGK